MKGIKYKHRRPKGRPNKASWAQKRRRNREKKFILRQKELAVLKEVGLLNDASQESPNVDQKLDIVKQTSSNVIDPEFRTTREFNIIKEISNVSENSNSLQVSLGSAASQKDNNSFPGAESAVKNFSTTQSVSNDSSVLLIDITTDSLPSHVLQNTDSSQAAGTSVSFKDSTLPISESSVNNSTKIVSNNSPFIQQFTVSDSNLYSSKASDSSLTAVHSNIQNFNTTHVTSNDLPSISNNHFCTSNHKPSILPVASLTVEDAVQTHKNPSTRTVATQLNFGDTESKTNRKEKSIPYFITYGTKNINLKPSSKEIAIKGRRIIDFEYFFKILKNVNNHSKFGCNLNDIIITDENKHGICTSYNIKCTKCKFQKVIWSENPNKKNTNLNKDFVCSMLSIKCNFENTNKMLAIVRLPSITREDFTRECDKILADKMNCSNTYPNTSDKNAQMKPQKITVQPPVSSVSDNRSLLEQVNLNNIIEDQFEIKKENNPEDENEPETILPEPAVSASGDKLIDNQKYKTLNMTIVKQEIISDSDDEPTSSVINEIDISNNESLMESDTQTNTISCHQKEITACRNSKNVEKQVDQQKITVIETMKDNHRLVNSESIMQMAESMRVIDQPAVEMPFKKSGILINVDDMVGEKLTKAEYIDGGTAKKKCIDSCHETEFGRTNIDQQISFASNKDSTKYPHVFKLNNPEITQGIPATPTKKRKVFEYDYQSNGHKTAASSVCGVKVTSALSTDSDDKNIYLISKQHMPKSNENGTLIVPEIQHNVACANSAAFIAETSSVVEQLTDQSSNSSFSLFDIHQSVTNKFPATAVNNPLILIPETMINLPLIQICNHNRTIKKAVIAKSFDELKEIAMKMFNYNETDNLKVAFENDGTEIDNDEEFQYLLQETRFSSIVLQIFPDSENWTPHNTQDQYADFIKNEMLIEKSSYPGTSLNVSVPNTSSIADMPPVSTPGDLKDFVIPWNKFPQSFLNACTSKKRPHPSERREVVRQIISSIRDITKYPPRKYIEKIAMEMVNQYPESLSDSVGPKRYASLFAQLENRVQHCNRVSRGSDKKIKFPDEDKPPVSVRTRAKYGCSYWQPTEFPKGENETLQMEKKEWLKTLYTLEIDNEETFEKMSTTYASQRLMINSKKFNIDTLFQEWPYLFKHKYFMQHANMLLHFNPEKKWREQLLQKLPKLIRFFRTIAGKKYNVKSVIEAINKEVIGANSEVVEECALLKLLTSYFNEDENLFIRYFEEMESVEDILNSLRDNAYPVIAVFGNNILTNPKTCVCIHGKKIGEIGLYTEKVIVYFISYYIFNCYYQEKIAATLEFIQRYILNIEPVEGGHKRGGKRKRTEVHPLVLKLANKLESEESIWGMSSDE